MRQQFLMRPHEELLYGRPPQLQINVEYSGTITMERLPFHIELATIIEAISTRSMRYCRSAKKTERII